MTIQAFNDPIPVDKWRQFHEILCATGGTYLSTPYAVNGVIKVDYEYGDYLEHQRRWRLVTQPIVEVRKDQWWRRFLRRILAWV